VDHPRLERHRRDRPGISPVIATGSALETCKPRHTALVDNSQPALYGHRVLTISSRLDVMNRLGRLEQPGYPAQLARDLDLTRSNVSNHLSCLRGCGIVVAVPEGRQTRYELVEARLANALQSLVDVVLAVDSGDDCEVEDHLVVPRFEGVTA
jgi:DNA-binding transcriptional ArsR family regulator